MEAAHRRYYDVVAHWQKRTSRTLGKRGVAALVVAALAVVPLGAPAASGGVTESCAPQLGKLTAPGCGRVFADDGTIPGPATIWGSVDCERASRVRQFDVGGDRQLESTGKLPADTGFRRTTVFDGDNFYGERCELGKNGDHDAPNVLYREGQHRITFMSIRLPSSFPLGVNAWQDVMQMKQTQPAANGGGSPALSLTAFNGRWQLMQSTSPGPSNITRELWSAPARKGVWTRFAFDVRYSQHADRGFIQVHVDLNGDGDAGDPGELSQRFHTYTLKRETRGGTRDGVRPGASIPSHLRAGIYHNPLINCPTDGCSVDLDNVQVVRP
jgi:hypothetical protein